MEKKITLLNGLTKDIKENQQVYFNDGTSLTLKELTKWTLLVEAINEICDAAEEKEEEVDWYFITKFAKPHKAIIKYIDDCYNARLYDITKENGL